VESLPILLAKERISWIDSGQYYFPPASMGKIAASSPDISMGSRCNQENITGYTSARTDFSFCQCIAYKNKPGFISIVLLEKLPCRLHEYPAKKFKCKEPHLCYANQITSAEYKPGQSFRKNFYWVIQSAPNPFSAGIILSAQL